VIVGIAGGGLVVVIAAVVAIVLVVSSLSGHASAAKPSAVVTDYLTALSKGDSKTALSYLDQPADNSALLTDAVLAASNSAAPITGITVAEQDISDGSGEVNVGYLMGGTPVTASYDVVDDDGDGAWKISGGLGTISVAQFDGLGLTVNGQAVTGDEADVFPGTYELATSLPDFTLSGDTTLTVTDPFADADTSGIEPALSDAGTTRFRSLVNTAVTTCIASTTLAAGCGLDLPSTLSDGTQLIDGTIKRTLTADATTTLGSLQATLSYKNPTLAQGDSIGAVDVTAQCSQNGATGTCDLIFAPSLGEPSVDMSSPNPTVLWD
jgi:hypothetical protein